MKIVTIVGARPQFIKAAALSREFLKHKEIQEIIVHTGQHYDNNMSDIFFKEMEIPRPAFQLEMSGLTHGAMTGRMLEGIEKILLDEKPDYVLVYGDTNSTLAGALAAAKLHIKVIHVEAGLRSFNMQMPEEINRILTDRISDFLFCPSQNAVDNLFKEGFKDFGIHISVSGDVMQDAVLHYTTRIKEDYLKERGLIANDYSLATIHRAENTDYEENLMNIVEGLNKIASVQRLIVPLHPRTKKIISTLNVRTEFDIIEPVGYFEMLSLTQHANCIITDSGGLQKEAYFFEKFCITMRNETEWVELVREGVNFIVGTDPIKIFNSFNNIQNLKFSANADIYGGGNACFNIVKKLINS